MGIKKTFGFAQASHYRSETFNRFSQDVFARRGLLRAPDALDVDFSLRTITVTGGVTFIRQGLIVEVDTPTITVTLPENVATPFYLVVSTPDNIERDNVTWGVLEAPQDLSAEAVVVAAWDGFEWRIPDIINIDGLIDHREYSNVVYGHPGFNRGITLSHDNTFSEFYLSSGDLTDKAGHLTKLDGVRTLQGFEADPDFARIDVIMYRRPRDHEDRVGRMRLLPGLAMGASSRAPIKTATYGSTGEVNTAPKIMVLPDNRICLVWASGFSLGAGTLSHMVLSADRTTVEVGPIVIATGVSLAQFDVALDVEGNVGVVFAKDATNASGGSLYFTKYNPLTGVQSVSAVPVETSSTGYFNPKIHTDSQKYFHIFAQTSGGEVHFIRINTSGVVAVPQRSILSGVTHYSVVFDPEYHAHIAYSNGTDVFHVQVDDVGDSVTTPIAIGMGTDPQIVFTSNKEVYVAYRNLGRLYFWRFQRGSLNPELVGYPEGLSRREPYGLENVTYHRCAVDVHNNMHVLFADVHGLREMTVLLPSDEGRAAPELLDVSWAGYDPAALPWVGQLNLDLCSVVVDNLGALFTACGKLSDSYSNLSTALTLSHFGPAAYGVEGNALTAYEFAVPEVDWLAAYLGAEPTVGDRFAISGTVSNDGTFYLTSTRQVLIDGTLHRVVAVSHANLTRPVFTAMVATGSAQAEQRDSNVIRTGKMPPLTTYSFPDVFSRELASDQIYGLIHKPSNEIQLWNTTTRTESSGFLRHDSVFLTSAGLIRRDGDQVTWNSPLIIKDPMSFQLTIPANTAELQNDYVLYTYLPRKTLFAGDGDAAGTNKTELKEVIGLSPGMEVFIGDSDSAGTITTIVSISDKIIETTASLSGYRVERGAYIMPTQGQLFVEARNNGPLRPASDGTVDQNIFMVAYRAEDLIHFRNGALTLTDQEEGWLGEGPSENLLNYVGATSDADSDPNYSSNFGGMQGENLTSRLSAVDLRTYESAQDRNITDLRSIDLEFTWDAASETLSWAGDEWRIMVPNVGGTVMHTVQTGSKSFVLADNEVAYVMLNRTAGSGDLTVLKCAQGALPLDRNNRSYFVIAKRYGSNVFVGRAAQKVVDTLASSEAQRAEKTFKLIGGGSWTWASGTLTWTEAAYVEHIGLNPGRNTIPAGSDARLANDGDILYVDLNRKAGVAANLTVFYGHISAVPKTPHRVIVARRVGAEVYVGNMLLEEGVSARLERPYSNQLQSFVGQPTPATSVHNYAGSTYLQNWMSHETALAELDGRINQFFSMFPQLNSFKMWTWVADGSTSTLVVNSSTGCLESYGDVDLSWVNSDTAKDIIVLREGLKQQQAQDGVWPIVNARWHFDKLNGTTLRFKEALHPGEKVTVVLCNIATATFPDEYVWVGDGVTKDFDISLAVERPSTVMPFDPSNGNNDIMVWVEQYAHFQSPDIAYPIPTDLNHHDFFKVNSTTIRFQEAPRLGEVVVLRTGTAYPSMWAEMHWYGDGVTTTFEAGSNSYGNPNVRWSANTDVRDIIVLDEGIWLEQQVDYTKSGAMQLTFAEPPTPGQKITVRGLNLQVVQNRIDVYSNGTLVSAGVTKLDFRGSCTVTRPSTGEARITVTGGGGSADFTVLKYNDTGSTIPAGRAVCFAPSNGLLLADNTLPGRKNPMGITLQELLPGAWGLVQYDGIIADVITGAGVGWNEEAFLGLQGEIVSLANIPDTGSPIDEVVKLGEAWGSGVLPTDLRWNKVDIGGR